jgi:glycosyltransferase involved in cell wall biosynthesis
MVSLIKYLCGCADTYASFGWKRIFTNGLIQRNGKVIIAASFCAFPFRGIQLIIDVNVFITNSLRIFFVKYILSKIKTNKRVVLWISNPYFNSKLIGKFDEELVCYNLCEDYIQKHPLSNFRTRLAIEDYMLSKKADILLMASEELVQKKSKLNKNTFLVPNGVDYDNVRLSMDGPCPADLNGIMPPIVGHIGLIGHHNDFALIKYLAIKRPSWSFVFVGPITGKPALFDEVSKFSNIYFLGARSAVRVPAYLSLFNVCALYYLKDYANKARNSMKLYLYLASGKPIVSYPIDGVQTMPSLVYSADNREEFLSNIEHALKGEEDHKVAERMRYAMNNSWDKRASDIHSYIVDRLKMNKEDSHVAYLGAK